MRIGKFDYKTYSILFAYVWRRRRGAHSSAKERIEAQRCIVYVRNARNAAPKATVLTSIIA